MGYSLIGGVDLDAAISLINQLDDVLTRGVDELAGRFVVIDACGMLLECFRIPYFVVDFRVTHDPIIVERPSFDTISAMDNAPCLAF